MHHTVVGQHGAARVLMAPAKPGTGIIAGGPMRAVFEVMGVTDIVCQEPRLDQPVQHRPRHARRLKQLDDARRNRGQARQDGRRDLVTA